MGLAEALVNIPQFERGGEIAQRGFDYQTCWALSQMLEYELNGKNYVFIFEYHDDVVIIDDEIAPQKLTFAQVKTRENHWTAYSLSCVTKQKPISIIGKLFLHQKNFAQYTPKLLFVTNASFNLCDESGGKTCFNASEVKNEHQLRFKKAIREQVDLDESKVDLATMEFIQSPLSLDDHITHLKGKLCNFISKKFGNNTNLSINALTSLLEQECRNKSKAKSADIKTFSDLITKKGFSSKALNSALDSLNLDTSLRPDWENASSLFQSIGKNPIQLVILKSTFTQICIEISQPINNPSTVYLNHALNCHDKYSAYSNLKLYIENVISTVDTICPDHELTLSPRKKECIVIYSVIMKLFEEGEE